MLYNIICPRILLAVWATFKSATQTTVESVQKYIRNLFKKYIYEQFRNLNNIIYPINRKFSTMLNNIAWKQKSFKYVILLVLSSNIKYNIYILSCHSIGNDVKIQIDIVDFF